MVSTPVLGAQSPRLDALTGIRAVAAGWVVVEHFHDPLFTLLPWTRVLEPGVRAGYLGVEIFFVLSGFIISYNYAQRLSPFTRGGYRRFLEARFARIYPVHLFSLLLVLALVVGASTRGVELGSRANYTWGTFLSNVFLVHEFPGGQRWNGPAWSICCEAVAYVAFPLLAWVVVRTSGRRAVLAAAVLLAIGIVAIQLLGRSADFNWTGREMVWVRIVVEFSAGCLLWRAWSLLAHPGRRWDVAAALAVVGTFLVIWLVPDATGPVAALTIPLLALFVVAVASAAGPVRWLLDTRPLEWGGRISYSVYMTHFIVLVVLGKLLPWDRFEDRGLAVRAGALVAYLLAVLVAGAATYHLVEEPLRKGLRRVFSRAEHVPATTGR